MIIANRDQINCCDICGKELTKFVKRTENALAYGQSMITNANNSSYLRFFGLLAPVSSCGGIVDREQT
jgi:hypothetical protein